MTLRSFPFSYLVIMKKLTILLSLGIYMIAAVVSCTSDHSEPDPDDETTDAQLFAEISASGYTYYQNGNILAAASASPHGSFKLRVNSIAAAVLDANGELPAGSSFPTGSIVVKEVYSGSTLTLYAVMKKVPTNKNAGSGWIWAEVKTDGNYVYSTMSKGDQCVSCHSASQNRDLVRTYDLH
jgi:hypothetical protein